MGLWFLNRPRPIKRTISVILDFLAIPFSLWLAFSLRLGEFYIPPNQQLWIFVLAPVLAIPIFIKSGLYRAIIRYIGMDAIWTIARAVFLYSLIFSVIVLTFNDLAGLVPRTVYAIQAIILMLFVGEPHDSEMVDSEKRSSSLERGQCCSLYSTCLNLWGWASWYTSRGTDEIE
ncbi:hypothetical protein ACFQE2_11275 [Methylophaga thalassica]|uniref:hypothetical protein n=1 Tax=Methylophaga thalassica TaxID=40223 RepID=UPI003613F10C